MMSAIQIPDDLKRVIERQVAEGRAASAAEFLEAAVRRYANELDADDVEAVAAAEQGLAALRDRDYTTVDDPQSRRALWKGVGNDASARLAELRSAPTDDDTKSHDEAASGPG
jgi:Arc/MetJ-type ribon-helix-helix transcriptional regulator